MEEVVRILLDVMQSYRRCPPSPRASGRTVTHCRTRVRHCLHVACVPRCRGKGSRFMSSRESLSAQKGAKRVFVGQLSRVIRIGQIEKARCALSYPPPLEVLILQDFSFRSNRK